MTRVRPTNEVPLVWAWRALVLVSLPLSAGAAPIHGWKSFAYRSLPREDFPTAELPGHVHGQWQPVETAPEVPERYPEEPERLAAFAVPEGVPVAVAAAGQHLYVATRAPEQIYVVSASDGSVGDTWDAPGARPAGLDWDGKLLWHADAIERKLYAFDADGTMVTEHALDFHSVGVACVADEVLVGDWESARVVRVGKESGRVLGEIGGPDREVWGIDGDDRRLWCVRGHEVIYHDVSRGLPLVGFSPGLRWPAKCRLAGVSLTEDRLWLTDRERREVLALQRPRHGQWIAGLGRQRDAAFVYTIANRSNATWDDFAMCLNVPLYEMPGQRLLSLDLTPEPKALYVDDVGNLIAYFRLGDMDPGDARQMVATARMLYCDRRVFVDPDAASRELAFFDVWDGTWTRTPIKRRRDCPACAGRYDFLDGDVALRASTLCGQGSVQVLPPRAGALDLDALAGRLGKIGEVDLDEFMLRFQTDGCEMVIFPDGRAIIMGTDDQAFARGIYARYIGS